MKKARIVIGANYGDEGKGTVVASYTKKADGKVLNVLTNGGAQRGHSILTKDGSITYHHFGSGTYYGADTYYSRFFILNPMQFIKEYEELIVKPEHIYRDADCFWTTPYDMMANAIEEVQLGRHASCRMGIWNTITRYRAMRCPSLDRFVVSQTNVLFLAGVKSYYERWINIPSTWRNIWDNPGIMDHFIQDCRKMVRLTTVTSLSDIECDEAIFENGQGLLLSDTGRDTFDTTPSDTGSSYARYLLSGLLVEDVSAHYVTRPYLTRHGDGDTDGEVQRSRLSHDVLPDRTNRTNAGQGKFRYGLLNITGLKDRILADSRDLKYEIELTHCDEMDRSRQFEKTFRGIQVNTYDTPLV